ncbi:MAG: PAS domain-containing protein, partial [Ruminiclostridium sp.]|nr:PAS domain-containing protein [Ruminiclostridium sp.]
MKFMYRCHLNLYIIGSGTGYSEVIKGMTPPESFTHDFFVSPAPEKALTEKADVIFLFLKSLDELKAVLADKKEKASVIVLAEKDNSEDVAELLSPDDDLWILPLTDKELKFRLDKWQKCQKADKDFWETKYFFEATINSIPNLVWYKTKDGIHEKVNDSFCKTVGKTKEQVEGRDHAYIWDVDPSDTKAVEDCAESDRIVMECGATCTSEETVLSGNETKLLTTYKSPLYDLDGEVMGTVGVAIDITKERSYENEIIEKNKTLESLFATIDCGVICQTVSGSMIISINHA